MPGEQYFCSMTAGKLMIKRADINDAAMLTELSVTTFRDKFAPMNSREDMEMYLTMEMNAEKLSAELSDSNSLFFLAYYDELPIGYAKLRTSSKPEELVSEKPIEIERLYVLQAYQSKKAGKMLMDHCIAYATGKGHDVIWLGVWEHNDGAIRFYSRFGFERFGSHPFILGNDIQTDILMKRAL